MLFSFSPKVDMRVCLLTQREPASFPPPIPRRRHCSRGSCSSHLPAVFVLCVSVVVLLERDRNPKKRARLRTAGTDRRSFLASQATGFFAYHSLMNAYSFGVQRSPFPCPLLFIPRWGVEELNVAARLVMADQIDIVVSPETGK